MKYKIKLPNLPKLTRGLAAFVSVFTMVMSPVAQGVEAQKISKQQVQDAFAQMGLNKSITFGEFYTKNKDLFPPRVQKEIEPFITKYKNQLMPQFEVTSLTGTDGVEVPTLRVTQGKELMSVQIYGEKEKWAKVQNSNLTEIDIINFNDMFKRLTAGDEKIRKQLEVSATNQSTQLKTESVGYPAVTADVWHNMTQKQRAAYIVNMRLLWNDARKVLIEADKRTGKARKTSSNDSMMEKLDHLFSMLNHSVEAAGNSTVKKTAAKNLPVSSPNVKAGAGSTAFVSGDNCIVAGFVSKYSGSKCGVENMYDSYDDPQSKELIDSTKQFCVNKYGPSSIACNPYVYGAPNGSPACVSTTDPSFQIATHADGPCEAQSSLGSSPDFLKNDLKNANRYKDENRTLSQEELEAKSKEEQKADSTKVEAFLNGILSFNKKSGIDFKQALTDGAITNLLYIKKAFDGDINKARKSCELATANKNNEKKFWGACDQMHRRFLNIAQFIEAGNPGCKDGAKKVDPDTLKCICPSGPQALPGTSCSAEQPPPSCPIPLPKDPPACVPGGSGPAPHSGDQSKPPGVKCSDTTGGTKGCICDDGSPSRPGPSVGEGDDAITQYVCGKGDDKRPEKEDKECGILCKIGKAFTLKNILIAAGAGLAIFGFFKILNPKKSKIKSAGDICDNGTNAPCTQTCASPTVWRADLSSCGCTACTAPLVSDAATCNCVSSATILYTCPDGVTKVADSTLATCPPTNYPCWDGTIVTNKLNCPERPSTSGTTKSKATK